MAPTSWMYILAFLSLTVAVFADKEDGELRKTVSDLQVRFYKLLITFGFFTSESDNFAIKEALQFQTCINKLNRD